VAVEATTADIPSDSRLPRFGRYRSPVGIWVLSTVALACVALNPWDVLDQLPAHTFVWVDFLAIAAGAYAAGLCLTRWRNPPTLWLALAFGGFTLFVLDDVAALTSGERVAYLAGFGLWWTAPTTVAAWVEASFAITRSARLRTSPWWQTALRAGVPVPPET
jgi:hypothetical protein